MRKELDEQLCSRYPGIFADRYGDKRNTAMCWGFDCGDGWYTIIDTLCHVLSFHVKNNQMPPVKAVQVKEKFGGLRFYIVGGDERADHYIEFAESLSFRTCESCGSTKDVSQTSRWIKTLCVKCMDKNY